MQTKQSPIHCDSCGRFIYDGYDRFYVADNEGQPVVIDGRDFVICGRQKCAKWQPPAAGQEVRA